MINYETGSVDIDVHFLEHLLDCIKRQKRISLQPVDVQAEWQAVIDITTKQVDDIVKLYKDYQQLHSSTHSVSIEFFQDEDDYEEAS